MANLKEIRERIKSVKSTQQITKAMKMVAAAKLRKVQDRTVQFRPYAMRLRKILQNIHSQLEGDVSLELAQQRQVQKAVVVLITSNKGLCGAFNSHLIKKAQSLIDERYKELLEDERLYIITIGKKGRDFFRKHYPKARIVDDYIDILEKFDFDVASSLADFLMRRFVDKTIDEVYVVYSEFKNPVVQIPHAEQFLPLSGFAEDEAEAPSTRYLADYIYEPSKEKLLRRLIPTILRNQFYRYLLDTSASEHGARMTAMDNATENANELLGALRIRYNKARQESITREILDIVSGARALEGG